MKTITLSVFCIFQLIANYTLAQINNSDASIVIESMLSNITKLENCHFEADLHFKEFGGDTFVIRKFSINYKTNIENPLYGYDCEISETFMDSSIFTIMALNESIYGIFTGTKIITERKMPTFIEIGSYFETLRNYFILPEVIAHFINQPSSSISLIDSNDLFYLNRQLNETENLQLILDKKTLLPLKSISIVKSEELDLSQIMIINFFYDDTLNNLLEFAFSPTHYISMGYKYIFEDTKSSQEEIETISIPIENQILLLNYSFETDDGDTNSLNNYTSKYILLDFWFASCVPCLKALPELNQLSKKYSELDLTVIGLNCFDSGVRLKLVEKIRSKGISFPLLFGSRDLVDSLYIYAFPSYYLITPDRTIEPINGGVEEVEKILRQLLGKN